MMSSYPTTYLSVSLFQTLHIAVVCSGHSTSRQVVILIKSILFYRRNPLHFHFVSDKTAITILTTLFQSWNIPLGECLVSCFSGLNIQLHGGLIIQFYCEFMQWTAEYRILINGYWRNCGRWYQLLGASEQTNYVRLQTHYVQWKE